MSGFPIWYELMTPDPAGVSGFYRAVLGWEIQPQGGALPGGSDYRMIVRADGGNAGGVLTLTPAMQAGGATSGWLPYFDVEDVAAAVDRVKALGGQVWSEPMTLDVGTVAMVADPQGASFYLMDPVPPANAPAEESGVYERNRPGHGWWHEVVTNDEPGATAFYTALFDWTAQDSMPMGDRGVYRFIEHGGRQIGAVNPWMPPGMPVSWLIYFGVADIEAARDAARASGGSVTQDIHEVPGGDFIFAATDPAGAPVSFVGPKAGPR